MLEGRAQKIIKEMVKQEKVKYFNFETPRYINAIIQIKDNWQKELKEKGISVSIIKAEYPTNIF